jgi:hypothetical protein
MQQVFGTSLITPSSFHISQFTPAAWRVYMNLNKFLALVIGFALLFLAGCSQQTFDEQFYPAAATIWVATTGSNTSSCGAAAAPCASIAYAVGQVNSLGTTNAPGSVILVKNGTYNETTRSIITVSGTTANPIILKAENVVTSTTGAKNVIINYTGPAMGWAQGVIEGANVSNWIIEGFRIQSTIDNVTVTYGSTTNTIPLPRMVAGIIFANGDNITIRYNHTFKSGISGIIFRPASSTICPSKYLPGSTSIFYFDTECGIQSTGNKVLYNKVELPNQGWKSGSSLNWEQEALTMWGVDNFEVAYNLVVAGTKEGIDVKLGRNGTIHNNTVEGVGTGIPAMNIAENGVAIYLDGRREAMYNIKIFNNIVKNNKNQGITVLTERPVTTPINSIYNIKIYNNIIHGNGSTGVTLGDRVGSNNGAIDVEVYHNTLADNFKTFMLKTFYDPALKPTLGTTTAPPKNILVRNNIFANYTAADLGGLGNIIGASTVTIDDNFFTWKNSAVTSCTSGNVPPGYYLGGTTTNIINTNNIINCSTQVTAANPNPVKFVSLTGATYWLNIQSTSPAINQGDTNTGPAPTAFAGNARPSSYTASGLPPAAPDMGAYEYQ